MSKVRLFQSVFFVCASFSMMMCTSGEEGEETESLQSEEQIAAQIFTGKVVDGNNAPIAGARVTINGVARTTSSTGSYVVTVSDSNAGYAFDIRKNGYSPMTFRRMSGVQSAVHQMVAGFTQVIEPSRLTTVVETSSGIQVTVPANSLRSISGGAPVGSVRFTVIPTSASAMPGDFTGVRPDGTRVSMESIGAVTLQAVDSAGNALRVATGSSLSVRLPVPASAGGRVPSCVFNDTCRIPMWRYQPATGLWVEAPSSRPTFSQTDTTFPIPAPPPGLEIDQFDIIGTWNADIDTGTASSCIYVETYDFPSNCYPITISLAQNLPQSGGGFSLVQRWNYAMVSVPEPLAVIYNVGEDAPTSMSFKFPAGATCSPVTLDGPPSAGPNPPMPPGNVGISIDSGPTWGGVGRPTNTDQCAQVTLEGPL